MEIRVFHQIHNKELIYRNHNLLGLHQRILWLCSISYKFILSYNEVMLASLDLLKQFFYIIIIGFLTIRAGEIYCDH